MEIINFATFGLFVNGKMIDSGSIQRMENEALRGVINGEADAFHISVFDFEGDTVKEEPPVLAIRKNKDRIIICNMLLKLDDKKDTDNQ